MDIKTKLEQTKRELTDTDNQIKLLKAKRNTLQKVYDDLLREYTAENSNNIGWLIQNPDYPDYYKNLYNLLQKKYGEGWVRPGYILESCGEFRQIFGVVLSTAGIECAVKFVEEYGNLVPKSLIKIGNDYIRMAAFNAGYGIIGYNEDNCYLITNVDRFNQKVKTFATMKDALLAAYDYQCHMNDLYDTYDD